MSIVNVDKDAFKEPADTVLWTSSMMEQQAHGILFEAQTLPLLAAIIEDGLIPVHRAICPAVQGKPRWIMAAEDPFGVYPRCVYELMDDGTVRRFTPKPADTDIFAVDDYARHGTGGA